MVTRLPTKLEILFLQLSRDFEASSTFQALGTGEIKVWGSLGSRNAQKHLTKKFHMWSKLLTGDSWSGVFRGFGCSGGEPCCCVSPQSQDHFLELFSTTDFFGLCRFSFFGKWLFYFASHERPIHSWSRSMKSYAYGFFRVFAWNLKDPHYADFK